MCSDLALIGKLGKNRTTEYNNPTPEQEQEYQNRRTWQLHRFKFGEKPPIYTLRDMSQMYHALCHSHEKPRAADDRDVYLGRLLLEEIFFESYHQVMHEDADDFAFTHQIVETLMGRNTSRDRLLAAHTLGMEQYLCAHAPDRLRLPVPPDQAADQWRRMLWSELDERLRRTLGFKMDVVRSALHQQAALLTPELHQLADELHRVAEEFPRAAGRLTERGIDFEIPDDLLFPPDQEPIRYPGYG